MRCRHGNRDGPHSGGGGHRHLGRTPPLDRIEGAVDGRLAPRAALGPGAKIVEGLQEHTRASAAPRSPHAASAPASREHEPQQARERHHRQDLKCQHQRIGNTGRIGTDAPLQRPGEEEEAEPECDGGYSLRTGPQVDPIAPLGCIVSGHGPKPPPPPILDREDDQCDRRYETRDVSHARCRHHPIASSASAAPSTAVLLRAPSMNQVRRSSRVLAEAYTRNFCPSTVVTVHLSPFSLLSTAVTLLR